MNFIIIAFYFCLLITLYGVSSFVILNGAKLQKTRSKIFARRPKQETRAIDNSPTYVVGEDIPEEVKDLGAIYDFILVERFNAPEATSAGIYLPKIEGKDQKKIGKVLSIGKNYGLESEQGRVQSLDEIAPVNVGDIVYIKDPWGVGPKDIQVNNRCFSFHKAVHILGVIKE